MTDTTEKKALAIWSAAIRANQTTPDEPYGASCDAAVAVIAAVLKEHEAFRQEVSDAVSKADAILYDNGFTATSHVRGYISRFIIAKPVDPLVEVLEATGDDEAVERAWRVRSLMANRGYEWRKIEGEG